MGDKTAIEWTGATLNPIRARSRKTGKVGWFCIHVSEGCRHCYAETMNEWRGNGVSYAAPALKDVELFLDEAMLAAPLRWTRPRRIFVCSMTDLFADFVPDEWIDRIFAVMMLTATRSSDDTGRHTFQILTKRPQRMLEYLRSAEARVWEAGERLAYRSDGDEPPERLPFTPDRFWRWPLEGVWVGVSVEDQATADARIPLLLQTPAAVRWVSYEPALARVDFDGDEYSWRGWLRGWHCEPRHARGCDGSCSGGNCPEPTQTENERLNWLVVGGESGPGARPFDLAWARSAIAQGRAAGVPVFVKQLGAVPTGEWGKYEPMPLIRETATCGWVHALRDRKGGDWTEWPEDLRVREWPK